MEGTLLPGEEHKPHLSHKFGFKTKNYPSQSKQLQNFEKDLLDTFKVIKPWIVKDTFQIKLKEGISNHHLMFMPLTTRLPT